MMWNSFGVRGHGLPERFEEQYHCYSVAYADKAHLEGGDKILLPPSAFDTLARLNVDYPMLFRLQSSEKGTMTHCGVLEFTAEEGSCYIPFWMMQNLLVEEGSVITVANVSLPKATFVKLRPQHTDFLDIANPRAVLEHALRNFSCVTKGDVVCLPHNGRNYHFELKEVKPSDAACIIETDCNVDFEAPLGYKEPGTSRGNMTSLSGSNTSDGIGVEGGGNIPSSSSSLLNLPKQSPYASSSSLSISSSNNQNQNNNDAVSTNSSTKEPSLKIVNGQIVRPAEDGIDSDDLLSSTPSTEGPGRVADLPDSSLAECTGATGVQRNSAIAVQAPSIQYWAVGAGTGARLDGKKPTKLKDSNGKEVDIRALQAEAAQKRLALMESKKGAMPVVGVTVDGKGGPKVVENGAGIGTESNGSIATKRKSRIGSKYSTLKKSGTAFQGSGHHL
mmetsp:Transcript_22061/g.31012  ORF Transcript_22061/g.31012 Transcript_22061/m.31012 type:complete len:446 (+) Transcript_22061:170-1507(+)|eukprot:CAMPEP_0184866418 /NCGR_PEP_ID=MMETSP0580-20130426/22284_1 /TAXON_ID=1118495 /ORGANISM="Dactyliosolen fragilissimus" /LENGTH=445 /DNA_ID=CAMNT_0027366109 /DNA_START=103 /DNA_END=1440 /DNA_ORIENTATION=+